ncbi:MAG: response regulator [Myxococcales bacterium]|nr:response regulator [Myxococcales bacterium]
MSGLVLLVEDDAANQRVIEATIRAMGHRVESVPDGQAALDALADLAPDLILLDWRTPRLSGAAALAALRAVTPAPIVVVSAFSGPEQLREIDAAGPDGFLGKPFRLEAMHELVARWLTDRPADTLPDPD